MDDVFKRGEARQLESWRSERAQMHQQMVVLASTVVAMSKMLTGEIEMGMADGNVVIPQRYVDDLYRRFIPKIGVMSLQESREPTEDEEEVPYEDMRVVMLLPRDGLSGSNGRLVVPDGPRIVKP